MSAPPPILRRAFDVRPGELATVLLSTLAFFCVLASYSVLKPIREEIGITQGPQNLPQLWTGTLAVTLLLAPLVAWFLSRYPRRVFLPLTFRFFALNLLLFALLVHTLQGEPLLWTRYAFYFWLSAFNMFVMSLFWALMADIFRLEQSRRLFGFLAVGGTLGALLGAWFTKSSVHTLGSVGLMLCSVVLLEISAQLLRRLAMRASAPEERALSVRPSPWSGMRLVFVSPYLRAIGVYILLQTLTSAFLQLEYNQLVYDARSAGADRTAEFANRDMWTQGATLFLQLFVTGRLLTWFGVSATLAIQPFVALTGVTLLAWVLPETVGPGAGFAAEKAEFGMALWTMVAIQASFSATQNGCSRPARETLFTVVGREGKYKAKSFLDTVVLRAGDALFAWSHKGLHEALKIGGVGMAAGLVPFAAAWIGLGYFLGRRQERLAAAPEQEVAR